MVRRLGALSVLLALVMGSAPLLGQAPTPAHPRELRFTPRPFVVPAAEPYRHQLANGVVVYVVEDHALPLVDVALALRAGDYLDPADGVGTAGLTAAMLLRGGTTSLPPDAFDERADLLGAQLSSTAGSVRAGATLACPSWVLEEALDLFFDMLRAPRFDEARLQAAKSNLLASFAQRNDDAADVLDREWDYLLYGPDHYLSRQLTAARLAAVGRERLAAFHRRYWQPRGMVLAISGDVDTKALLAGLERRFTGWTPGEPAPWPPPAPAQALVPGLYHVEKATPQAKVAIGHLTFARRGWDDPDAFAAIVMGELLGGSGPSSRIGGRLRTAEGIAYHASAGVGVGDTFPGELRISLESANATVGRAVELALAEVARLRRETPSGEEVRQIERSLVDSFPYLFDSAEKIAGRFAEDEYLGRPHTFWRDYRARIEQVTPEQVRRIAERVLHPEQALVLVVGPWREMTGVGGQASAPARGPFAGAVHHLPPRDPASQEPQR
ncbi:MAG TPA: pitrilysin family protein [Thermoanaerobaculia bacterium]|nr:pitrilysin family protein [Thermoanaerobaculia bacterium]